MSKTENINMGMYQNMDMKEKSKYYCSECEVTLPDFTSYIDHLNNHKRPLLDYVADNKTTQKGFFSKFRKSNSKIKNTDDNKIKNTGDNKMLAQDTMSNEVDNMKKQMEQMQEMMSKVISEVGKSKDQPEYLEIKSSRVEEPIQPVSLNTPNKKSFKITVLVSNEGNVKMLEYIQNNNDECELEDIQKLPDVEDKNVEEKESSK